MDLLERLLSSRARAEVLRLLFSGEEAEYYLREIERRTGLLIRAVQQELRNLLKLDLARLRKDGNRTYYSANREHPLYPDLVQIVVKTSGWLGELRRALSRDDIRVAFVFGSFARGEEGATSDIDVIVIGAIGSRAVSGLIGPIQRKAGREINPHVYTESAFARRAAAKDHFVASVISAPKIFLIGNENELEAVGRKSAAQTA